MVIVETTRGLPYVYGEQTGVHVSEVDYVIEGDDAPAPDLPIRHLPKRTPRWGC